MSMASSENSPSFVAVLVEDDVRLADLIVRFLSLHDIVVHHAANATDGLRAIAAHHPDIIVADWMLPDLSGVELCRRVRERSDVPIVMLTARDSEADRVAGLAAGADDYVVKPFSSPELLARLRAHVRRARGLLRPVVGTLVVGPLKLDTGTRSATLHGGALDLTTYEFELLAAMAARSGKALSREQLIELVTGAPDSAFDRAIDVHISNLRSKLGDNPRSPRLLKTVRGIGYTLAWGDEPGA